MFFNVKLIMEGVVFLIFIVFLSSLIHSTFGFGFSMICMSFLSLFFGLELLLPLIPLLFLIIGSIMIARGWKNIKFRSITFLAISATLTIPFGIYLGFYGHQALIKTIIGLFIILFSLYNLFAPRLPRLYNSRWAPLFGGLSGLFGGAYNISGPPIVIYATLRQWSPSVFRVTLQAYFLFTTLIIISNHIYMGSYNNPLVLPYFLFCLPAMILGVPIGKKINRSIKNPAAFNKYVYILMLTLGLLLILKTGIIDKFL
jgi:uncharacterized membrane protein YfcA